MGIGQQRPGPRASEARPREPQPTGCLTGCSRRRADFSVVLPRQEFFDVTNVSVATIVGLIVVGALAAGMVEEAAFRGFMQGSIERSYGPTIAILISGTFFGLAHYLDVTPLLLPYYLAVAAI